jgi:AsmA-like C-terminal region
MAPVAATKKSRVLHKALVITGIVLVMLAVAAAIGAHFVQPYLGSLAEDMLSSQFRSDVKIQEFHVALFPTLSLSGKGIVLRHHGRTDVPPLISIGEFSGSSNLWSIFVRPWHVQSVTLKGLKIQIPPREKREGGMFSSFHSKREVSIRIDQLVSDDAELDIIPGDPEKSPHVFLIHHLHMHAIGPGHGAPFEAQLTNAIPPGEIQVKGNFGPWQSDDPRSTPLSASYTFEKADLNAIRGISGILSSDGKFSGVLEKIEVQGQTTTPDFSVDTADHPVMLKTEFSATVDGTNGDTLLHPVIAHFLNSTLICNGAIVTPKDKRRRGKEVELSVRSQDARIQDLLRLVIKAQPPIKGTVNLQTKFDLPPAIKSAEGRPIADTKVMDRLELDGKFGMSGAQFADEKVREKIEDLSRRGQGHPDDEDVGDAVSRLKGNFGLHDGVISLNNLAFSVTGANVHLDGTYKVRSEELDFHGELQLQAKPSQAVTGVKSWLLKPFDSFFRKNGVTELPIKVTGTRSQPSFGLDFHHKDKDANDKDEKDKKTAKR